MTDGTPRILVVEDDPSIALGLRMNLQHAGYTVQQAADGPSGLAAARRSVDLILMDVMLPGMNGFEVLKTLRAEGIDTPVLMLTAKSEDMEKILGLDLGADDYITKPFSMGELLARVRAALRRTPARERRDKESWRFGAVKVVPATREVFRDGEAVALTSTEFDMLTVLREARERVLSREQIFAAVWGEEHVGTLRTIDNFMRQLRAKLEEDPGDPKHLLTVRGVGYRLVP